MVIKYSFFDDYTEGGHPRILKVLEATNLAQEIGYGDDRLSRQAIRLIKRKLQAQHVDVHFVSGGTQANLIALAAMLKPYESVIAVSSAHINIHEAGAVEATGHKINAVEAADGKLTPSAIRKTLAQHADEHMVKPGAVFVSQATELGTVYSKAELEKILKTCEEAGLYLYLDGARLGSAIASREAGLNFADLPLLTDIFYIGGTKNGALLGEALVIVNPVRKENFRFYLKQHGALLAKGRVLGAQFVGLFKDGCYLDLARHANLLAAKLSEGIKASGYRFLSPPTTNQIFPILPNAVIDRLREKYGFHIWAPAGDGHSVIRLVTSWATKEKAVEEFLRDLSRA
jgi:threonine aldolase